MGIMALTTEFDIASARNFMKSGSLMVLTMASSMIFGGGVLVGISVIEDGLLSLRLF